MQNAYLLWSPLSASMRCAKTLKFQSVFQFLSSAPYKHSTEQARSTMLAVNQLLWESLYKQLIIIRAHSFLWQILPNSADHFAKFHGSLRQNCSNSMAHCSLTFVSKLSCVLSCQKNCSYWRLAFCLVMLATFIENYQSFCFFKSAVCQVRLCLFVIVCRIVMAISRADSFKQFSLNFDSFN